MEHLNKKIFFKVTRFHFHGDTAPLYEAFSNCTDIFHILHAAYSLQ